MKHTVPSFFLLSVLIMVTSRAAFGYIDPGSGALIWQIVAGVVLGGMFYFKTAWRWITSRGKGKSSMTTEESHAETDTENEETPPLRSQQK